MEIKEASVCVEIFDMDGKRYASKKKFTYQDTFSIIKKECFSSLAAEYTSDAVDSIIKEINEKGNEKVGGEERRGNTRL